MVLAPVPSTGVYCYIRVRGYVCVQVGGVVGDIVDGVIKAVGLQLML